MKKFLLWDNDGVLVDTERWYFISTQESLLDLGVQLDQATYLKFMATGRSCWDLAKDLGRSEISIQNKKLERNIRYQQYITNTKIEIDGVREVLQNVSRYYRMAIVSTSRRADFELIHKSRSLIDYFEFVITIEDCEFAKPHPDPYRRALQRFDCKSSEAIAIEDSSRGLRSANAAGIDCVIIHNEFTASQDFTGAWKILHSIHELPKILNHYADRAK